MSEDHNTHNAPARPEGFDAMIAQRAEAVGGDGTTFPITGFGRTWYLKSPSLASAEWKDNFSELSADLTEGHISSAVFRDEMLDMVLGDQAEDFADACDQVLDGQGIDPIDLINEAMREHQEKLAKNPSRGNSRNIRGRAKRR